MIFFGHNLINVKPKAIYRLQRTCIYYSFSCLNRFLIEFNSSMKYNLHFTVVVFGHLLPRKVVTNLPFLYSTYFRKNNLLLSNFICLLEKREGVTFL